MTRFVARISRRIHGTRGQGIIEYAGALIIATVLVATVLSLGVDRMLEVFNGIVDAVQNLFTTALTRFF